MKTAEIVRILTILSSALAAFLAGLALLPIPSDELPMPPSWRPYLAGIALLAAACRVLIVPTLDAIIKSIKATETPPSDPSPSPPPTPPNTP